MRQLGVPARHARHSSDQRTVLLDRRGGVATLAEEFGQNLAYLEIVRIAAQGGGVLRVILPHTGELPRGRPFLFQRGQLALELGFPLAEVRLRGERRLEHHSQHFHGGPVAIPVREGEGFGNLVFRRRRTVFLSSSDGFRQRGFHARKDHVRKQVVAGEIEVYVLVEWFISGRS